MVWGYCRVSTSKQEDEGTSLQVQRDTILEHYPNAIIISEAYSGAKSDRPRFNELVEKAQKGDTIVCTKLDRFCRSLVEGTKSIQELQNKGVQIHILNFGVLDNTTTGRLISSVLLAVAEFERGLIIERTQSGRARKRESDPTYKEGRPTVEVDLNAYLDLADKVEHNIISVGEAISTLGCSRSKWYRLQNDGSRNNTRLI